MPSPILARADALMNRKRPSSTEPDDDIPVLTDAVDDDIPVLHDISDPVAPIVTEPEADLQLDSDVSPLPEVAAFTEDADVAESPRAAVVAPSAQSTGTTVPPELLEQLARTLSARVEQRLRDELPRIIESVVCDFLAEQHMIAAFNVEQ